MVQKYNIPEAKITKQEFELYKEGGEYYLRVDFDYEDEYGFYKGHADKIKFDMSLTGMEYNDNYSRKDAKARFCAPNEDYATTECSFDVLTDSNNRFFTIELVKEKVHEMTVEEIENKLGYKIKIVPKSK